MQLRLMGSLIFLTLCSVPIVAQTSAPNTPKPPETPSAVHRLYVEDQEDTRTIKDEATNAEYLKRVKVREQTLRTMLSAGQITPGDDFLEAAFIFQHGDTADDCLFAHILAMEAMARGTPSARWIAAATLDRYLQFTNQPQVFGTQYIMDPTHPVHVAGAPFPSGRTLKPYNDSFLSDAVRTDFCVPTLAQQEQNVAMFNAGIGNPAVRQITPAAVAIRQEIRAGGDRRAVVHDSLKTRPTPSWGVGLMVDLLRRLRVAGASR